MTRLQHSLLGQDSTYIKKYTPQKVALRAFVAYQVLSISYSVGSHIQYEVSRG